MFELKGGTYQIPPETPANILALLEQGQNRSTLTLAAGRPWYLQTALAVIHEGSDRGRAAIEANPRVVCEVLGCKSIVEAKRLLGARHQEALRLTQSIADAERALAELGGHGYVVIARGCDPMIVPHDPTER